MNVIQKIYTIFNSIFYKYNLSYTHSYKLFSLINLCLCEIKDILYRFLLVDESVFHQMCVFGLNLNLLKLLNLTIMVEWR